LERVVALNNRVVTRLTRCGTSLRSDVRRIEEALAQTTEKLSETDHKLNTPIDIVDQRMRGNGRQREN
jgi:hypothetical protein